MNWTDKIIPAIKELLMALLFSIFSVIQMNKYNIKGIKEYAIPIPATCPPPTIIKTYVLSVKIQAESKAKLFLENNFENMLNNISGPEIKSLRHEDLLARAIIRNKHKAAVSFWWLSIPIYIIAAFVMKSTFMPGTSFISILHGLISKDGYTVILIFIVIPAALIVTNMISLINLYRLSGKPAAIKLLQAEYINVIFTVILIILMIIYFAAM